MKILLGANAKIVFERRTFSDKKTNFFYLNSAFYKHVLHYLYKIYNFSYYKWKHVTKTNKLRKYTKTRDTYVKFLASGIF